jgi:ADP-ribose pyrophosphatase YjhB (NUDIX family)
MTRDYPSRPIVSAAAIVWRSETVLLIKRAKEPNKGKWSLPGGAQELGETVHECLKRELREETGIEIEIEDFIGVIDAIHRDASGRLQHHYTILDYAAVWVAGELRPGDDAAEARFVSMDELGDFNLPAEMTRVIAESYHRRLSLARGSDT